MTLRFVPVPYEAMDLVPEGLALLDLYRRGHSLKWRPFRVTSRSLATGWGCSTRRVWDILETLADAGLIEMTKGGKRQQSIVQVLDPQSLSIDENARVSQAGHKVSHKVGHKVDQNTAGGTSVLGDPESQGESQGVSPSYDPDPETLTDDHEISGASPDVALVHSLHPLDSRLPSRVLDALQAAGIDSLDALCSLSARELVGLPDIGRASIQVISRELESTGRALAPPPPTTGQVGRPLMEAWCEVWREVHQQACPHDFPAGAALLGRKIKALGDKERARAVFRAFLLAHRQGPVWPADEPPTVRKLLRSLDSWLTKAVPAAAPRRQTGLRPATSTYDPANIQPGRRR